MKINLDFLRTQKCLKCGRKFRKVEELMQHEQVVHGKDLLYECKKCGVGFSGMEQMRDHIKKFHSYKGNKKQDQI